MFIAEQCGLKIPETQVTNSAGELIDDEKEYVVKSLNAALFCDFENNKEMTLNDRHIYRKSRIKRLDPSK